MYLAASLTSYSVGQKLSKVQNLHVDAFK